MSLEAGRPLRVLQVMHDYHPVIGGSELLFRKIAEGLVARGVEVTVFASTARRVSDFVASDGEPFPPGTEKINGVLVRRFSYRQFSRSERRGLDILSHVWSSRRWPGYGMMKALWVGPHLPGLVGAAVQYAPDVIGATAAPFLPIYRAAQAARRGRRPFAVMPCLHPGDRWMIDNPSLLRLLRSADAIMALTPYEMRLLRALGVSQDRLWLIGGGVDPDPCPAPRAGLREQFAIAPNEPLVLFMGRKEAGKGIQDVLEAMANLWQREEVGTLVLAGASSEFSRSQLARVIARLPPEWKRRVVVRDDIPDDEKWGWYAECQILAHPSHVESFGLVYLEAWLCGKPVIGGRTGPQASLIDEGKDGFLVRPGAIEELAATLARLLSEPGLAIAMGREGRAKVLRQFTWDSVVDRAAAMYLHLATLHEQSPNQRDHRHAQ